MPPKKNPQIFGRKRSSPSVADRRRAQPDDPGPYACVRGIASAKAYPFSGFRPWLIPAPKNKRPQPGGEAGAVIHRMSWGHYIRSAPHQVAEATLVPSRRPPYPAPVSDQDSTQSRTAVTRPLFRGWSINPGIACYMKGITGPQQRRPRRLDRGEPEGEPDRNCARANTSSSLVADITITITITTRCRDSGLGKLAIRPLTERGTS
jgi:hypothetical protein